MQDIYNERSSKVNAPSSNSAVLFTADFDTIANHPSGLTLLSLTSALRELLQHNNQKQIAVYISSTNVSYKSEITEKSSTLINTLSGLISFIKSYQEINTSFVLRGTIGWEFLPLLTENHNVFITNGTSFYTNRNQLPIIIDVIGNNKQILHNIVDLLAESSNFGIYCDFSKMKQLGFSIQQYN